MPPGKTGGPLAKPRNSSDEARKSQSALAQTDIPGKDRKTEDGNASREQAARGGTQFDERPQDVPIHA